MAVKLGTSFDVVEAVRSLATDQQSLQEIVAGLEARVQVLERPAAPRPLITVGDLVAESETVVDPVGGAPTTADGVPKVSVGAPTVAPKATGRVKGEAQVVDHIDGRTDRKA